MAKPKLTGITIRPSKGGGHKVVHEYAPAHEEIFPAWARGAVGGNGMSMDQPPPEEHNFLLDRA